MSTQTLKEEHE